MGEFVVVAIPRTVAEKVRSVGVDLETFVLETLAEKLCLDPAEEARAHLDLARKFLEEGKSLIDKDPMQASEKLYKAAEESVKALAKYLHIDKVLERVKTRGRWTVTDLEKAVEAISDRVGRWFEEAWDRALALHVWGFHEAKLDSEAVRRRLPYIERMVSETEKLIKTQSTQHKQQ